MSQHEIETRKGRFDPVEAGFEAPAATTGRVRQCRRCGCSASTIAHFGWDDCPAAQP